MTSFWSVPAGLVRLRDVVLPALPLLALVAARNPMRIAPEQVSAASHSPAAGRQTAPAFPGGCWHVVLAPSHASAVQGSPSSEHAAPGLPAGCWQALPVPLH